MKTLHDYTKEGTTRALDKAGAFFAFSNEQLEEKRQPGIKYANMGAGLICPVDNAKTLNDELNANVAEGVRLDIEENGLEAIIKRELYNHEAFYTGELDDTIGALGAYNVTAEQVAKVYRSEYANADI